MKSLLLICIALGLGEETALPQSRYPVEARDTVRRSLEFSGSGSRMLELDNIAGAIHVESGRDGAVEVVAARTIRADSEERLQDARREVTLDFSDRAETVRVYVDGPMRCNCANPGGWPSTGSRRDDPGYRVNIDFEVRVPAGTKLRLRTVTGGDITVDATTGDFEVENTNGRITMTDIRGSGSAHTVNGAVKVSFGENPRSESSFRSVNGAIEVSFQPELSADLQMKTFNGSLYTDFAVQALPGKPAAGQRVDGKFIYRANAFTGFRVGSGGPQIKFDGFNGDVRVLRRSR